MLLIYTDNSTTRLQYICRIIFKVQLGISYSLTSHRESFEQHEGARLVYADKCSGENCFHLRPHNLLLENNIQPQDTTCFEFNGRKAFFKTSEGNYGFDIFAASFYLLSRYEEYLPHDKDEYGRYAHKNSLAFKEGFLNIPLVSYWIQDFGKALQNIFPSIEIHSQAFNFLPTYDIDIAFSTRHKGLLRTIAGFFMRPSLSRIKAMAGLKPDEYASYDFLDALHKGTNAHPLYFFLVAPRRSRFDKNISPFTNGMWQLMKRHANQYKIGLHPSWRSNNDINLLQREKKILETVTGYNVTDSRQHYIQFNLPQTFEKLIASGITDDYSMGYGSINGFRASIACSFGWYNLSTEKITGLNLHPFCFMDANSFYEQKQTAEESYNELMHFLKVCKAIDGQMITIFHNQFLGTEKSFAGWKEMYQKFTSQLLQ